MLIAIDAHNLEGDRTGVGTYLFNLIREWEKMYTKGLVAGISFVLYFKDEVPEDILSLHSKDKNLKGIFNVEVLRAPFGLRSNTFFRHYSISKAVKRNKANILFSPDYVLPRTYKGKSVLTIHDLIYEAIPGLYNWPSIIDRIFLKKWGKKSAEMANIVVVPSNFTKQEIIKHYQIDPDKIEVTPLAVSSEFNIEVPGDQAGKIKRKYGIYDKYIVYVGSIFNRRHLPEIIQAFEDIFPKFKDYQLIIVGFNHTNPHLDIEDKISATNKYLQNMIGAWDRFPIVHRYHIDQGDLLALYKNAQASIYLSDYEGFGLPVLESMASGTPVITSRQGALMETAGEAALFVDDNNDVKEISEKMAQILSNEELRTGLKRGGIAQVSKFSWFRCANQTMKVFKKVLSL